MILGIILVISHFICKYVVGIELPSELYAIWLFIGTYSVTVGTLKRFDRTRKGE